MRESGRIFLQIVATLGFFLAAFGSLFLPFAGPFVGFFILMVWYLLIGHHFVGAFLDRISKPSFKQGDIRTGYEKELDRLLEKNRSEEAEALCREWMKHDPENSMPHLRLCRILAAVPEGPERAIRHLEACLRRRFPAEHHIAIARELAWLYRQAGRPEAALPVLERVRSLYPGSPHLQDLQ
jgi:hypothetical protein